MPYDEMTDGRNRIPEGIRLKKIFEVVVTVHIYGINPGADQPGPCRTLRVTLVCEQQDEKECCAQFEKVSHVILV